MARSHTETYNSANIRAHEASAAVGLPHADDRSGRGGPDPLKREDKARLDGKRSGYRGHGFPLPQPA